MIFIQDIKKTNTAPARVARGFIRVIKSHILSYNAEKDAATFTKRFLGNIYIFLNFNCIKNAALRSK
jgi:hypothetical protein